MFVFSVGQVLGCYQRCWTIGHGSPILDTLFNYLQGWSLLINLQLGSSSSFFLFVSWILILDSDSLESAKRTWWICGSSSPCNCAMWLMSWLGRMSLKMSRKGPTAKRWKVQVAWACDMEISVSWVTLMDRRDGVAGKIFILKFQLVICQEFQGKSRRSPFLFDVIDCRTADIWQKSLGSLQPVADEPKFQLQNCGFLEETSWLSGLRWSKIQRKPPSDGSQFSLLLLPEASARMDHGFNGFPSFFWNEIDHFRYFSRWQNPCLSQIAFIYGKSVSAMIHHESWEYHRMVLVFSIISIRNGLLSFKMYIETEKVKAFLQAELLHLVGDSQVSMLLIDPGSKRPTQCRTNVLKWAVQCKIFFPSSGRIPISTDLKM